MAFLDQLTGLFGGNEQAGSLLQLLQQEGGVSGLIEKFQQGGLAETVQSWISTGENLPVSAEQIQSVLGNETVSKVASAMGVDPDTAASTLSDTIPQLVDKLTPNGELPQEGGLLSAGLDMFKNKFLG